MSEQELQDFNNFTRTSMHLVNQDKLTANKTEMEHFVQKHLSQGVKIACVTSGGTSVPLEAKTVRFIDNFSTGNRGSAITEYLLAAGYAVVFVHRHDSLFPFKRSLHKQDGMAFLSQLSDRKAIPVDSESVDLVSRVLKEGRLLPIPFTTLFDYLSLLHFASLALAPAECQGMLILAAAVSDFFLHPNDMATDKIQSRDQEGIKFHLDNTPKVLGLVKHHWAPKVFLVSFKLETDDSILLAKAGGSIDSYGVDLVVANLLGKHDHMATLVERAGSGVADGERHNKHAQQQQEEGKKKQQLLLIKGGKELSVVTQGVVRDDGCELELPLVDALVVAHQRCCSRLLAS